MDMKTIKEYQRKGVGEIIGDYLKLGWVFERWYEKVILVVMGILALWKLGGLIF